jgi:glycosyltransferase involved in cell wall biosynthesis
LLAGTGAQRSELESLAAQLQADVTFLGYLKGEALHAAIRASRAVVLPSEWYENAPMSILEAYALGKPVLGARIGGIPELLREGTTGFGFVSGDAQALSGALRALNQRSDAEVEEMGRQARAWVEKDFSAAAFVARITGLYAELGVAGPSQQLAHASA